MMTREEIAAIDRACEEQHISQQEYLDSHGIAKHQYYRWKRKYREEDECKKQVFDQQFSEKLDSADFGKLVLHIVIDKAVMRQRAAASLLGA